MTTKNKSKYFGAHTKNTLKESRTKKFNKIIKKLLLNLLLAYIAIGIFLYAFQTNIIYQPSDQDFYNCQGFSDYTPTQINSTRAYVKTNIDNTTPDQVLVYFHGNAGRACDRSPLKYLFDQLDKTIIFVEYTGYGNSTKKPSKKNLLQDSKNIAEHVIKNYDQATIIGQSIGSIIASHSANLSNSTQLILISPFNSIQQIASQRYSIYPINLMLKEDYNAKTYLENYKGNIKIIHAKQDYVVPASISIKHSQDLKNMNLNVSHTILNSTGHNSLWDSTEISKIILNFVCEDCLPEQSITYQ